MKEEIKIIERYEREIGGSFTECLLVKFPRNIFSNVLLELSYSDIYEIANMIFEIDNHKDCRCICKCNKFAIYELYSHINENYIYMLFKEDEFFLSTEKLKQLREAAEMSLKNI